jgi:hypothetical protein
MAAWTCPDCKREFGAVGRGHMCTPGLSIDEFLNGSPVFVGPVLQRVHEHLLAVDAAGGGELIVDPLDKKVLLKNGPTFAIFDVKTKWVAVGFSLRRKLESGRLSRKVSAYGSKYFHVVNITEAESVDDELCDWLTEAYHHGDPDAADAFRETLKSGDGDSAVHSASSSDPMMPDDIDFEIAPPR